MTLLVIRLLVNHMFLVVNFGDSKKLYTDFLLCRPNTHNSMR